MHWWTVEYGLIGSLENPKIYGAGLLSSVGESQNCLSDSIKKIPLSIDCINYSYDITEQQPQLFVAKNFSQLTDILYEFEKTMSFYNNLSKKTIVSEKNYNEEEISELNQTINLESADSKLVELYNQFESDSINVDSIIKDLDKYYPNEWLLRFNIYKENFHLNENWTKKLKSFLSNFQKDSDLNNAINRGLELIEKKIN